MDVIAEYLTHSPEKIPKQINITEKTISLYNKLLNCEKITTLKILTSKYPEDVSKLINKFKRRREENRGFKIIEYALNNISSESYKYLIHLYTICNMIEFYKYANMPKIKYIDQTYV